MKFSDYGTIRKKYPNGAVFITDSIMVVPTAQPCAACRSPTKYLDTDSMLYLCSDECLALVKNMRNEKGRKDKNEKL